MVWKGKGRNMKGEVRKGRKGIDIHSLAVDYIKARDVWEVSPDVLSGMYEVYTTLGITIQLDNEVFFLSHPAIQKYLIRLRYLIRNHFKDVLKYSTNEIQSGMCARKLCEICDRDKSAEAKEALHLAMLIYNALI